MYVASQILVVLSGMLIGISMLTKNKRNILIFFICSNIAFGLHFFFLNSIIGGVNCIISIVFFIAIYILEHYNKDKYKWVVTLICCITCVVIYAVTFEGFAGILTVGATTITFVSSTFRSVLIVKSGTCTSTVLNTVYMFLLKSYFGAITNIVLLVVNIVGLSLTIRDVVKGKKLV